MVAELRGVQESPRWRVRRREDRGFGVVDPLSVSAVTTFLGTVSAGMASESGRRLGEAVGAVIARVAGREVPAPIGAAEREAVARVLVARIGRNPDRARELSVCMGSVPDGVTAGEGLPPHLLPAAVRFFTDRKEPLALLSREASRTSDGLPRVAVVFGPEGIGTSETVYRWGGGEARRYPDGMLYADLRGGSVGTAPSPATVLRHFLLKLRVPAEHIPPGAEDRVDLFRSLLRDRRVLVVLDHAQSAAQARPLVTSAPGVFTVLVARRPLTGLDAAPVPVGPLGDKDSVRLLTDIVGKQTVAAARATLPSVLERCAGSPFALRAAAPHLSAPGAGSASGAGDPGDPVRSAAEATYRRLSPDEARVYRLASLRAWPALSPGPVAAAADVTVADAERLLASLAGRLLLEATADGRYRYRPAVRDHAETTAIREDGLGACAEAVTRTVDWFVRFAIRADFAALPERWHLGPLYDELGPGAYESQGAAVAALVAELGNLVEAVLAAEEFGRFDTACQGTQGLYAVQLKAGHHDALLPALRAGVRAAERNCPDTDMAGRMHTQLAMALTETLSYEEAAAELTAAAEAENRSGHLRGRATAVETLGLLRLRQWRFAEALECFEDGGRVLDGIGPADRGFNDLPRARALLERHRGRALRGLGRYEQARQRIDTALAFFRASGTDEPYNAARALTDLAEIRIAEADHAAALVLIDEAVPLLSGQNAAVHLDYLAGLRRRCLAEQA